MLPLQQKSKAKSDQRLQELLSRLPETERKTLLDFAEFLVERAGSTQPEVPQQPLEIPRPAEESVVAAMKRLRQTYPMLDHSKMLHEASGLMAEHMMQGRPAPEVIDELQQMFLRHFEKYSVGSAD